MISYNDPDRMPDPALDERLARWFRDRYGMQRIYLTTSCSAALEMAADILDVGPGDEVILPSYTYVTTALAFVKRGATPVFAEIEADTCVMDLADVARKITPRTRVIVPVHYAGISVDMDALLSLTRGTSIRIVEDAAQALDARYKGRALGTIGDIGTFSFHHTKNLSTGEGGMLVLNDPALARRADVAFEKGTDRQAFISGEVDHYSWVDRGGSYGMASPLKSLLLEELKNLDEIQEKRRRWFQLYMETLQGAPLGLPRIPKYAEPNWHIFAVRLASQAQRDVVIRRMRERGIQTVFHYQPLHRSAYGRRKGYDRTPLPVTDTVAATLLRLPLYPSLEEEQIRQIAGALRKSLEETP